MPVHRIRLPHRGLALLCAVSAVVLLAGGCASAPAADGPAPAASTASTLSGTDQADATQALHDAIAGIDAAVYASGVIGAHVHGPQETLALRAIETLDRQRAAFALALGGPVNEAGVAYQLPGSVTNTTQASALAELLEMKLIPLFDDVASASTGATHALGVTASRKAAQRAQKWQASATQ